MKNFALIFSIVLTGIASQAQSLNPLVIEKYQIYPEQLETQRVEKIRHTYHFFEDGKRVDNKSYLESMKINFETGDVDVRTQVSYTGKAIATYYFYEDDYCSTPTSEDYYEVSEDENVEDRYIVSRIYTLDEYCRVISFRDEDDDTYQIRKQQLDFNDNGMVSVLFDWNNNDRQWAFLWDYIYTGRNYRIVKKRNNYQQTILHQCEYLNDKEKVIKRCNINAEGKEVDCATFDFEYDKDYILKESVYVEGNKLLRQIVYTRDANNLTQKITTSIPNSEGKMVVTEEHTFEYFTVK